MSKPTNTGNIICPRCGTTYLLVVTDKEFMKGVEKIYYCPGCDNFLLEVKER